MFGNTCKRIKILKFKKVKLKKNELGTSGDWRVKNPPANTEDTGSIWSGRPYMPRATRLVPNNWAQFQDPHAALNPKQLDY